MKRVLSTTAVTLTLMAVPAIAKDNPACEKSNGNASFCGNGDSANGGGVSSPNYGADKLDQTATSELRVDSYLNAELTGGSEGFSNVIMEMNESGEVEDELFTRTFRVASNADHEIQIWYDSINFDDVCVPVFDAEGTGSIAGEADVIGGQLVLAVGDTTLFSATAGESLENADHSTITGVSVACDDASETGVGAAVITVRNEVASTFSREYTLSVTAHGEGGSIIFADGDALNAGDAPAGQYDNDILIAAGTLNSYGYNDANDAYANASFGNNGASYYGN